MDLRYVSRRRAQARFDIDASERLVDFEELGSLLFFDPRRERSLESIGERFRELEEGTRNVDLVIIRGSELDFPTLVEQDPILQEVVDTTPVLVLSPKPSGDRAPHLTRPAWATEADCMPDTRLLRDLELRSMIANSTAVFGGERCHYLLPAGHHSRHFIRLADALGDSTELIRVADWLIPFLKKGTALVADTGSLLALLTTVQLLAQRRFGWDIPIATLNQYATRDRDIRKVIAGFEAQEWNELIFVISVNSSGSLAESVRVGVEQLSGVAILCDTQTPCDPDCFVHWPVERWAVDGRQVCPECKNSHLLVVDPTTYEVRPNVLWKTGGLYTKLAQRQAAFWEAVDRAKAVVLHVERPTVRETSGGSRHLSISIEVDQLLTDPAFRARALDELSRQPTPELVLVPDHAAAESLTTLAIEALRVDPESVLRVPVEDHLPPAVAGRVSQAERVLVLDDALIKGWTLIRLRKQLYEIEQARGKKLQVYAFVIVSQPSRDADEEMVKNSYTSETEDRTEIDIRFACVEKVLVPEECPWCREYELLNERLVTLKTGAGVARARLEALRGTTGIDPPLLIGESDGPEMRVVGSLFGNDLESRAAFAATASVAQRMTQDYGLRRAGGDVQARIYDASRGLRVIYDPILIAGILRTMQPRDTRDPGHDTDLIAAILDFGPHYPLSALAEVTLAALDGKLPLEPIATVIEGRIESPRKEDDLDTLALLVELIKDP